MDHGGDGIKKGKQAGLSRATLEISSNISYEFTLGNMSPGLIFIWWNFCPGRTLYSLLSVVWFLVFPIFKILNETTNWHNPPHWEPALLHKFSCFFILIWSPKLKIKIWGRSDQLLLRYLTFNIWGFLPYVVISRLGPVCLSLFILIWSPKFKFKISGRSDQWLVIYSTFNILRSSSNWGCLRFKNLQFWLGSLSLSLKSEEDPMSGSWERSHKLMRWDGWWMGGLLFRK